jgi:hypothetical protein
VAMFCARKGNEPSHKPVSITLVSYVTKYFVVRPTWTISGINCDVSGDVIKLSKKYLHALTTECVKRIGPPNEYIADKTILLSPSSGYKRGFESKMFLRNVDSYLLSYTVSHNTGQHLNIHHCMNLNHKLLW